MSNTVLDGMTVEKRTERWTKILEVFHGADPEDGVHRGPTFVAETEDGDVIGFCSGGTNRDKLGDAVGEIYALYVLKAYWGGDIGRALMDVATDEMFRRYETLILWVLTENHRAIAFYEKCGFVKDGATKTIKFGYDELPETRMQKSRPTTS